MSDNIGIQCPKCQSARHFVIDTRPEDERVMRRRKCRACDFRFTTVEIIKADVVMSEKHGNAIKVNHALALVSRLKTSIEAMAGDRD
ncbi:NrdR family transcriptional regulator [Hoeflea alexandrii]|uniref:Transcriptional repressor NrdR-like N-terminal domain-containing protein n=1 Tax=Hoeflea alexandrii TaxID=288436 RepID=A0ABT1CM97_9HYPH|nr:hypothetical protein [Hoeflea alexandrii]MCO6407340.1 hypothetical protein [Hoeflea alexandrii]MCY0154263.1 hypothetical protein [Hoeflea alexandrii]